MIDKGVVENTQQCLADGDVADTLRATLTSLVAEGVISWGGK